MRRLSSNENYFNKANESEQQFYIAGYLAARMGSDKRENRKYTINLSDSSEDLKFIKKALDIESSIKKYKTCYKIALTSSKIVNDIARFGIVMKKEYKMPLWLLAHKYLNHFLRGFVEAKAHCSTHTGRPDAYIRLYGSEQFLTQVKNLFESKLDIEDKNNIFKIKKANSYYISYTSYYSQLKILDFLYSNSKVSLSRKKHFTPHWEYLSKKVFSKSA